VSKLSVWIFNHYAGVPGGIGSSRHFELAKRLVRQGMDVTIVTAEPLAESVPSSAEESRAPIAMEEADGVRFLHVRMRSSYARNGLARVLNMLEFAVKTWWRGRSSFAGEAALPDVIIGSTPHLLTPLTAWILCKRFRVPFLMEVRDLWPETIVGMGLLSRRNPLTQLLYALERFLYARASHIISLLPDIRSYLDRVYPKAVVSVVPNGVDPEAFGCAPMKREEREPFRVVYAGTHRPANGLMNVVLAAEFLRRDEHIEIHLYGEGSEKRELIEAARGRGLEFVHFHDAVTKKEIPDILCQAHAFLLNYARIGIGKYGVSPNKLWEYMAAGRPVIFAHEASNNPVSKAGCGVSVEPEDPHALADAICELASRSLEELQVMGKRGRDHVREHHDWDLLGERFAQVLRAFASEGSRSDSERLR